MIRDDAVTLLKQRMGNNNDSSLDALIVTEMQQAQNMLEQETTLPWFLKGAVWNTITADQRTFTPAASGAVAPVQISSGTCTTGGIIPYLSDGSGTFLTDGVQAGDIVTNITTGATTTVATNPTSETLLTLTNHIFLVTGHTYKIEWVGFNGFKYLKPYEGGIHYVYQDGETAEDKVALKQDDYHYLWNLYGDYDAGDKPTHIAMDKNVINGRVIFPLTTGTVYIEVPGYYADGVLDTNSENRWLTYASDLLIAKTGVIIAGNYMAYAQYAQLFAAQEAAARARLTKVNIEREEEYLTYVRGGRDE